MTHALPDILRSGGAFLVVLGILVFVHEMGHYLAARACGVYVEAFSIGFGRSIATWTDRQGTIWVATQNGMARYNAASNDFTAFAPPSGPTSRRRSHSCSSSCG